MVSSDIVVTPSGNRIIVGTVSQTQTTGITYDFHPAEPIVQFEPANVRGGFVASYNDNGDINFIFPISDGIDDADVEIYRVETDAEGNIYVYGRFWNKIDVDGSESVFEISAGSIANTAFFISSYTENGEFRFGIPVPYSVNFLAPSSNQGVFSVDGQGNSYIISYCPSDFINTFSDFDPGPGEYINECPYSSLISYDNEGNFRYGFDVPRSSNSFSVGENGDIRISGILSASDADLDLNPGTEELVLGDITSIEETSFFIVGYNIDGTYRYFNTIDGVTAIPTYLQIESDGSIIIIGAIFPGEIDFDPSSNDAIVVIDNMTFDTDVFMAKYNGDGEYVRAFVLSEGDTEGAIANTTSIYDFHSNGDYLFFTGRNSGISPDFDPSNAEGLIYNGEIDDGIDFVASYNKSLDFEFVYPLSIPVGTDVRISTENNCSIYTLVYGDVIPLSYNPNPNSAQFNYTFFQNNGGLNHNGILVTSFLNNNSTATGDCEFVSSTRQISSFQTQPIAGYPNPSDGTVVLQLPNESFISDSSILIFDILGNLVHESGRTIYPNEKFFIDLKYLPVGNYLINIKTNKGFYSGRLLIQR